MRPPFTLFIWTLLSGHVLFPFEFADAAQADEMRVVIVRSAEGGCEPFCTEWISAEGRITRQTPEKFDEAFRRAKERRLPVVITSQGGDVDAAIAIGRRLRSRGVDVVVGRTSFWECEPQQFDCSSRKSDGFDYTGFPVTDAAFCNSACPLVLAGGVRRLVAIDTRIGLHQVTTTYTKTRVVYRTRYERIDGKRQPVKVEKRENAGTYQISEMSPHTEALLRSYLASMDIKPELVDYIKATKASDVRYLNPDELKLLGLANDETHISTMFDSRSCNAEPGASFCQHRDVKN